MLRAILNRSRRQHPTKHQLYGHLPPITKTIQVRRTRHAGHCWRTRDKLISDVLLSTPSYDRKKAGRLARTYMQELCEDTGYSPEDLPEAMNDREEWRKRVRDMLAAWHDDDDSIRKYSQRFRRRVLQRVFFIELGCPHRSSNSTLYLIYRIDCSQSIVSIRYYLHGVRIDTRTSRWFLNETSISVVPYVLREWIFATNVSIKPGDIHSYYVWLFTFGQFFYQPFLFISSYIVFFSIVFFFLGLLRFIFQ